MPTPEPNLSPAGPTRAPDSRRQDKNAPAAAAPTAPRDRHLRDEDPPPADPPQGRHLGDDELGVAASPGVGPHPEPWPHDDRLDPALLAAGDRRNVIDRYRYWRLEAIVADLDPRRAPLRVAIQNWEHDFNIGSMVRTANAFNVAGVHILGRRRWNRRGAMVTDRYLPVVHHPDVPDFLARLAAEDCVAVGVDNLPGAEPLETAHLPERACLVFGSEGPGLTAEVVRGCAQMVAITQYGSTRSLNAGAAAAIAMYAWSRQWRPPLEAVK